MADGEAVLQDFCHPGVDYLISSPWSERPPVWEALARIGKVTAPPKNRPSPGDVDKIAGLLAGSGFNGVFGKRNRRLTRQTGGFRYGNRGS